MIEIPTFLAVRFKGSSWRGCGGSTRLKVAATYIFTWVIMHIFQSGVYVLYQWTSINRFRADNGLNN